MIEYLSAGALAVVLAATVGWRGRLFFRKTDTQTPLPPADHAVPQAALPPLVTLDGEHPCAKHLAVVHAGYRPGDFPGVCMHRDRRGSPCTWGNLVARQCPLFTPQQPPL